MGEDRDAEFLRDVYSQRGRGDFSRDDMFDPEVEFVMDLPERRTYRGYAGAREAWRDFLSAWGDFRFDLEEVIRTGPGTYLVLTHLHARGKGSGAATERHGANLVELRDGRISRLELVWDLDEALSRAGLGPDAA